MTDLEMLRNKGARLRSVRPGVFSDRLFSTREWDICSLTMGLTDGERFRPDVRPLFRTSALNFCVISKEIVPKSAQVQLRPFQLATKVFFPYDFPRADVEPRKQDAQALGGRSFYVGQKHYQSILRHHFMGGLDPESQEADLQLLASINSIPSLDPFILKDRFETDKILVDPAYLQIDEERWLGMRDHIIDDFTPIAEKAFGNTRELRQRTSVLVQKLWEARDLAALAPLTTALKIREDAAQEVYYAWKGILFYKTQYVEAVSRMDAFFEYISAHAKTFQTISGTLTTQSWITPIKRIKIMIGEIRMIMDRYTKLREDFANEGARVGEFIEFFRMAPDFYWLIGGNLACFDHCLKLVHDFSKVGIPTPDLIDNLYRSIASVASYGER